MIISPLVFWYKGYMDYRSDRLIIFVPFSLVVVFHTTNDKINDDVRGKIVWCSWNIRISTRKWTLKCWFIYNSRYIIFFKQCWSGCIRSNVAGYEMLVSWSRSGGWWVRNVVAKKNNYGFETHPSKFETIGQNKLLLKWKKLPTKFHLITQYLPHFSSILTLTTARSTMGFDNLQML